jgi:hypothetical protein
MSIRILNELFDDIIQYQVTKIPKISLLIMKNNNVLRVTRDSEMNILDIEYSHGCTTPLERHKFFCGNINNTNADSVEFYIVNDEFSSESLLEMLLNICHNINRNLTEDFGTMKVILVDYNIDSKLIKLVEKPLTNFLCENYYIFKNNAELANYLSFATPYNKKICFQFPF